MRLLEATQEVAIYEQRVGLLKRRPAPGAGRRFRRPAPHASRVLALSISAQAEAFYRNGTYCQPFLQGAYEGADMSDDENAEKNDVPRGRPFEKGESGNPAGRPKGSRNRASLIRDALIDGASERLLQKALEKADGGDSRMLELFLKPILRQERPVSLSSQKNFVPLAMRRR
jgi:uncharacterized protein DUF5681